MGLRMVPGATPTRADTAEPPYLRRLPKPAQKLTPRTIEIERPLPQNIDAERSVLGAVILNDKVLAAAIEKLKPEDFFQDQHRIIFARMRRMAEAGRPVDLLLLSDELHGAGELERAGGAAYIASLIDGVPRVNHLEHWADIVKEKSLARQGIHQAHAVQQQLLDGEEPCALLARAAETMTGIASAAKIDKKSLVSYTAAELTALSTKPIEYIAYPFAARGILAAVDGAPKSAGKTTLICTGSAESLQGGLFLNRATQRGPIVLITEENDRTIRLVIERAGLSNEKHFHVVPLSSYAGTPWPELVQQIERLVLELKATWLILDTFFAIAGLGGEEESKAGAVDQAVAPLRRIAAVHDVAITLGRHERKSGGEVGVSGRGSSALTGAVDVVCLLRRLPGKQFPNRRQLEVTGRLEQACHIIELLEDGRYIVAPDGELQDLASEADRLDQAIAATPGATKVELQTTTGIGRNKIEKLAAQRGWTYKPRAGWSRGQANL